MSFPYKSYKFHTYSHTQIPSQSQPGGVEARRSDALQLLPRVGREEHARHRVALEGTALRVRRLIRDAEHGEQRLRMLRAWDECLEGT